MIERHAFRVAHYACVIAVILGRVANHFRPFAYLKGRKISDRLPHSHGR